MTDIQADHEEKRPRMMRTVIPDKTTALTASQAITAALLARERSGQGQHIELNMLDATIAFMWPEGMMRLTVVGDEPDGVIGQIAQDLVFETADGHITVSTMSDDQWIGACRAFDREEWINDPRFSTTAKRFENIKVRLEEMSKILAGRQSDYWLKILDDNGVPCAPILSRYEMLQHEQIVANDIVKTYDHPHLGEIRQPKPAARLTGMSENPEPLAPTLGEHNEEILNELGFTAEQVAELSANGVLSKGER